MTAAIDYELEELRKEARMGMPVAKPPPVRCP
jgi:hypothetical protein